MYCKKCGKEINDDAAVCIHCGCAVAKEDEKDHNQPKNGIGFVMAFFLGIIGLIIGICMYPEGTIARNTFIKSWCITFFVTITVCLLLYGIIVALALAVG